MTKTSSKLQTIWESFNSTPFNEWVEEVSTEVMLSGLGILRAARLIDVQPAELLAVMKLATLEPEDLVEFSRHVPPRTTWLTLADASHEEIVQSLNALENRPEGSSPSRVLDDHIRSGMGAAWEDVLEIPAATLLHMQEKSVEYKSFGPRSTKAFKDFARRKKNGQPLSIAQAEYLRKLLEQMADTGAISRNSRDNDQAMCDQVLDALGRA